MKRILLWIIGTVVVLWVLLNLGLVPAPLVSLAAYIVGTAGALACPLFWLVLIFAPGLFRDSIESVSHFWRRLHSRRFEIDDLKRKIVNLDRAHHRVQLGNIFAKQGRRTAAAELFKKALEKEPDLIEAQYRLALCHFDSGNFQEAARLLEAVHTQKPGYDYGTAYLRLAQSQHRLGNQQRAKEIYETMLRFYPGHPEGSYHFALLEAELGNIAHAQGLMRDLIFAVRHSPPFQRRRNRHWSLKAHWWLWRHGGGS